MEFLFLFVFLLIINVAVVMIAARNRKRWFISGGIVMLLIAPLVLAVTGYTLGVTSGDGIGGGVAGFTFGAITFANGLGFIVRGFMLSQK
ncbi:hypothetical protein BAMA_14890 [Bacillus manliponensis]|uniref:Inner-membrane translocator n=1 Tax=Bacillus manliponensis TaxID=574376 RepID=A0A073K2K6_9BACI|nr:hypothetical protein [Bacillus manliponensis]KEK20692.1 hypothetical protein BAMA_14890 [Bacillus manliponensis]